MQPFYLPAGPAGFVPTSSTGGPWSPDSQHGGPPAALLTRAIEELPREGPARVVGRFAMDLFGPVPLTRLGVEASVVRPGRSVQMCEATLFPVSEAGERGRVCARGSAWLFPDTVDGPGTEAGTQVSAAGRPLPHSWTDGTHRDPPATWSRGYLDAIEWRWITGAVTEPGPGVVWMRPRVDLVAGEPIGAVQRLMACVDSASGVSAALDPDAWGFVNTELTVHLLRAPVGEWVCVDAETTLGPGSLGQAVSRVYDERGLVARSAQALLVTPRPPPG